MHLHLQLQLQMQCKSHQRLQNDFCATHAKTFSSASSHHAHQKKLLGCQTRIVAGQTEQPNSVAKPNRKYENTPSLKPQKKNLQGSHRKPIVPSGNSLWLCLCFWCTAEFCVRRRRVERLARRSLKIACVCMSTRFGLNTATDCSAAHEWHIRVLGIRSSCKLVCDRGLQTFMKRLRCCL